MNNGNDLTTREWLRDAWDEKCVPACIVCLDSDKPREAFLDEATENMRIVAFGAMRRAVAIAREHESRAGNQKTYYMADWTTACGIRRAIRAAIGSEKA